MFHLVPVRCPYERLLSQKMTFGICFCHPMRNFVFMPITAVFQEKFHAWYQRKGNDVVYHLRTGSSLSIHPVPQKNTKCRSLMFFDLSTEKIFACCYHSGYRWELPTTIISTRNSMRYENKAGYTATSVACGWAGAVFELLKHLARSSEAKDRKNIKKVKWGLTNQPTNRPTDRPTDRQSGV